MGYNISYAMLIAWEASSVQLTGTVLRPNYLDFDEATGVGEVGYAVPDEDPPLMLPDGEACRIIVARYDFEKVIKNGRTDIN